MQGTLKGTDSAKGTDSDFRDRGAEANARSRAERSVITTS